MHDAFDIAFDNRQHARFARRGMGAGTGSYRAPDTDATANVPARFFIDHDSQETGDYARTFAKRLIVTLLYSDVPLPEVGGIVTIGDEQYTLQRLESPDGSPSSDASASSWVVEPVA